MSKHTAGPWTLVPQSNGASMVAHEYETGKQMNPKGLRLISMMLARRDSLQEDEANARLIAAAPDLLEALRDIAAVSSDPGNRDMTFSEAVAHMTEVARAAIAALENGP